MMHYAVADTKHARMRAAVNHARAEGLSVFAMSDHHPDLAPLLAWPWHEMHLATDVQREARRAYDIQHPA